MAGKEPIIPDYLNHANTKASITKARWSNNRYDVNYLVRATKLVGVSPRPIVRMRVEQRATSNSIRRQGVKVSITITGNERTLIPQIYNCAAPTPGA